MWKVLGAFMCVFIPDKLWLDVAWKSFSVRPYNRDLIKYATAHSALLLFIRILDTRSPEA